VSQDPGKSAPSKDSDIRYVNLYESEAKIYTRKITGFYQNIRRFTGIPLVLGYLLMPWIIVDGRPAILFDLGARKFHIWTVTFWPQDFMLLSWALIISAFLLFTVTVLLGRVWCGFTCPQTVWTLMFIYIEHLCEGDRNKRIKLDKQGWNIEKIFRKSSKHFLWLVVAFITGATFIGYFTPIRDLLAGFIPHFDGVNIVEFKIHPAAAFWTIFFTGMTYLNAGWLREQVCKYMCPYARFQSVMYDKDTLAVQYNPVRGEKRGARKPGDDYKSAGLGDCIDCSWCVQVCPVNIDIRDGLQYECINCGLCVDACNSVMDKMSYPRGLISFISQDHLETGKTRFFRPRLFGYMLALVVMVSAFVYVVATRSPLGVDVIRDRGTKMYRIAGDDVQNIYTIKINNMDSAPHVYDLEVQGDYPFVAVNYRPRIVESGEVFSLPVRISVPKNQLHSEKSRIMIRLKSRDNGAIQASEETVFIGPKS
jgi:cytochrome c oxidase accessory protein FixG